MGILTRFVTRRHLLLHHFIFESCLHRVILNLIHYDQETFFRGEENVGDVASKYDQECYANYEGENIILFVNVDKYIRLQARAKCVNREDAERDIDKEAERYSNNYCVHRCLICLIYTERVVGGE